MTPQEWFGLLVVLIIIIAVLLYLNPTWAAAAQDQWTTLATAAQTQWTAWTTSSASSTGQPAPVNTDPTPAPASQPSGSGSTTQPLGTPSGLKPAQPPAQPVTPVAAAVNPDGLVGQLCGVKTDGSIWCATKNLDTTPNWYNIPGRLSYISVDNGRLYGVGPGASGLFYFPDLTSTDESKWVDIHNGQLNNTSLSGDAICGTNSVNDVWCANQSIYNSNIVWNRYDTDRKLKQISLDGKQAMGVGADNSVWYTPDYTQAGSWKQTSGALQNVSLSGNLACGADLSNNAWCANITDPSNVNWQRMQVANPSGVIQTSIRGNRMFAVDPNNELSLYDSLDPANLSASVPKKIGGVLNQVSYW